MAWAGRDQDIYIRIDIYIWIAKYGTAIKRSWGSDSAAASLFNASSTAIKQPPLDETMVKKPIAL